MRVLDSWRLGDLDSWCLLLVVVILTGTVPVPYCTVRYDGVKYAYRKQMRSSATPAYGAVPYGIGTVRYMYSEIDAAAETFDPRLLSSLPRIC